MKIKTRLDLAKVKDMYSREYLKSQLEEGVLNEGLLHYLVSDFNVSDYTPIIEAIKKGITMEAIEECVSLLNDGYKQSDLERLLNSNQVINLSADMEGIGLALKFGDVNQASYYKKNMLEERNSLKLAVDLLDECRSIKEAYAMLSDDEIWELMFYGDYISEHDCENIKKYNHNIKEYLNANSNSIYYIPTMKSLIDSDLSLFDASRIDFDTFKLFQEDLKHYEDELLENNNLKGIIVDTLNDKYDLYIEKPTNTNKNTLISFKSKNSLEDNPIVYGDKNFIGLLIEASGFYSKRLLYTEEYEKKLADQQAKEQAEKQERAKKFMLGCFNISKIMHELSDNAWYGRGNTTVSLTTGDDEITMNGYIYEPGYESFSATSRISLNGETLYGNDSVNVEAYHNEVIGLGEFQNLEDVAQYLRENINVDKLEMVSADLEQATFVGNDVQMIQNEDEEDIEME